MGLEQTVADLNTKVENLTIALANETNARTISETKLKGEIQGQLRQLADLLSDNNKVTAYAIGYVNAIQSQYLAREIMLQDAIHDFNEFLKLPPKSSQMLAIWDTAWAIIVPLVPALRLTKFFQNIEKVAANDMALAKVFKELPSVKNRVATYVAKGHNIAEVIVKGNNIRDKVNKATAIQASVPLDSTKTPVKQLIQEALDSRKTVLNALNSLDAEFDARIHSLLYQVPYKFKGTLEEMANRLLPDPPALDIDQTGRFYLWTILGGWAKKNVQIVEMQYRTGTSVGLRGINDNQQEQIMEWFGPQSDWQGGRVSPVPNVWIAFSLWGVNRVKESSGGSTFGFG